jgi:hypothetical protein
MFILGTGRTEIRKAQEGLLFLTSYIKKKQEGVYFMESNNIWGFDRIMKRITGNGCRRSPVFGAVLFLAFFSLTVSAWGQEAPQDSASGGLAAWTSTADIKYTAAVYIGDGKHLPEKSSVTAVSGGTVGDSSASGIKITSKAENFNGVYVLGGKSVYTLSDAVIELTGNGSNDFVGIGTGAMADGGATLVLKNVKITTNGTIRSTTTSIDNSTLKVFDSTLIANGGPLPKGYKATIGPGMMEAPAPLGISGTSRACLTLNNSSSFFYNSTIIADGWGALSTDMAQDHVYLEANNCDVQVRNSGYATYADWSCKVVINNSRMKSGAFTGIIAGPGEIHLNSTEAVSGNNSFMMHSVMRDDPTEIGLLEIKGGKLSAKNELLLVKSTNADITLEGVEMFSEKGILLHSVINDDTMATKLNGAQVTGIRATLKKMSVEGNILHEDTQRTMSVSLSATILKGGIKNASISLDSGSKWTATADSKVTIVGSAAVSTIDAPAGVTITAVAGKGCTLKGAYKLSSGGTLNVTAG